MLVRTEFWVAVLQRLITADGKDTRLQAEAVAYTAFVVDGPWDGKHVSGHAQDIATELVH